MARQLCILFNTEMANFYCISATRREFRRLYTLYDGRFVFNLLPELFTVVNSVIYNEGQFVFINILCVVKTNRTYLFLFKIMQIGILFLLFLNYYIIAN